MAVLGAYGIVVHLLDLDFSRLPGAYFGIFAVVSVIIGRWMFKDQIPVSTWIGLAIILAGKHGHPPGARHLSSLVQVRRRGPTPRLPSPSSPATR
jgi:hypothetical protein